MSTENKISSRKYYAKAVFQYYWFPINQKPSDRECRTTISHLDKAIELHPDFGEAYAFREEVWHYRLKKQNHPNPQKIYREEYLKSAAWKAKREKVMERDNKKCIYCGEKATEVHHKDYKDIGQEDLSNLIALCNRCHNSEHPNKEIEA